MRGNPPGVAPRPAPRRLFREPEPSAVVHFGKGLRDRNARHGQVRERGPVAALSHFWSVRSGCPGRPDAGVEAQTRARHREPSFLAPILMYSPWLIGGQLTRARCMLVHALSHECGCRLRATARQLGLAGAGLPARSLVLSSSSVSFFAPCSAVFSEDLLAFCFFDCLSA